LTILTPASPAAQLIPAGIDVDNEYLPLFTGTVAHRGISMVECDDCDYLAIVQPIGQWIRIAASMRSRIVQLHDAACPKSPLPNHMAPAN
jgi:hypothetical protein